MAGASRIGVGLMTRWSQVNSIMTFNKVVSFVDCGLGQLKVDGLDYGVSLPEELSSASKQKTKMSTKDASNSSSTQIIRALGVDNVECQTRAVACRQQRARARIASSIFFSVTRTQLTRMGKRGADKIHNAPCLDRRCDEAGW